jgi:polyphosphate kinase
MSTTQDSLQRTDRLVLIPPTEKPSEADPRLFLNRELSWLAFNERVLDEARDRSLPVYERLKFLSIVSSNLDEFFMIRVAGLKQQVLDHIGEPPSDGMLPADQLAAISERVHALSVEQDKVWREQIVPALEAHEIRIVPSKDLTDEQRKLVHAHFIDQVLPALTPLAVDPGHPFPHLKNKSLNVAVLLLQPGPKKRGRPREKLLAVVQVPMVLKRLVPLPGGGFTLLDDLIEAHAGELFPGYQLLRTARFRVTRNSDLLVDEEETEDLLSTIQAELRRRELGDAVRLELAAGAAPELETILANAIKLGPQDVYHPERPLRMADLMQLAAEDPRAELRVEPLVPSLPPALRDADSLYEVIQQRDVILHHPYESFDPVVRFVDEAADDPSVVAIKMTLYRTSGDSPFVRALSRAAQSGKQVAALVEIKARFDEANNIQWARRLEENGVHVVYGVLGLKTHCKVALIVRREGEAIRRYVHLGTGNYNPQTARQYTDLSFFTQRREIAEDVSALFNMLTGYSEPPDWKRLAVAPLDLQTRVIGLIGKQAERARRGEPARIVAKLNSLVDPSTIRALYAASQAGVDISLIVRGICCLRPGIAGISDRISVTSVVDRFLEHSRVFAFGPNDDLEVFISSADWMPRNFVRRIEVMCPIEDPQLRRRLVDEVLGAALRDNQKARRLDPDGSYSRVDPSGTKARSQIQLLELARASAADPPLLHGLPPS